MDRGRRRVLRLLGEGSVFAAFLAQIAAAGRALMPNVLYEPPKRFPIKRPDQYPQGLTFDPARRLFVIRSGNEFHVISAICTHLGCTVQSRGDRFACPCHGSVFDAQGVVLGGPAPRPLPWFELSLAPSGELEVDSAVQVPPGYHLTAVKALA